MEIYPFDYPAPKPALRHRLRAVALMAALFVGGCLIFDWIWPSSYEKNYSRLANIPWLIFESLLWGFAMVFIPKVRWLSTGLDGSLNPRLLVDEESITLTSDHKGRMSALVRDQRVHRGQVRSIFKVRGLPGQPGGIGISERSQFGARMLGFVYIPETLPEFEHLKQLAERWRTVDSTN